MQLKVNEINQKDCSLIVAVDRHRECWEPFNLTSGANQVGVIQTHICVFKAEKGDGDDKPSRSKSSLAIAWKRPVSSPLAEVKDEIVFHILLFALISATTW